MNWRYAAASVVGTSHVASGMPCQDAHFCSLLSDCEGRKVLVLAASDGAGSARHGAVGALSTVSSFGDQFGAWLAQGGMLRDLNRATCSTWLDGIREAIADEAGTSRRTMRDYAATLIFAVVGEFHSAFGQIGDGAIVTSSSAGEWERQFTPRRGMYANETFFVTDEEAHAKLQFAQGLRLISEVSLFTDGLERLLLDLAEGEPHPPAFEKMFQPLRAVEASGFAANLSNSLTAYLATPAVASRTDDDVTLVIATSG